MTYFGSVYRVRSEVLGRVLGARSIDGLRMELTLMGRPIDARRASAAAAYCQIAGFVRCATATNRSVLPGPIAGSYAPKYAMPSKPAALKLESSSSRVQHLMTNT